MLAAIERERPGAHLHRLPEQPDRQPVGRRGDRRDRRRGRRAGRPGGVRRGLPAVLVAHLDASAWRAHEHVLVMRTLSKFGLAGVRLGYLCGHAALIDEIDKVRPPYNISVLNAEATLFALDHADEFARAGRRCCAPSASALQAALRAHARRDALFPSEANMILVRVPDAKRAFEGMKARGVLVKNVAGTAPAAGQLPAPDRRHARREHADDRRLESQPVTTALGTRSRRRRRRAQRRRHAQHQGNADPRRASTSTARARPSSPPASASSTTCSTRSPATA